MKCKCPLCDGTGKIEMVVKPLVSDNKKAAQRLSKKGYTVRQIMKTLGYKNPGSISHLLKK